MNAPLHYSELFVVVNISIFLIVRCVQMMLPLVDVSFPNLVALRLPIFVCLSLR